jgi:exodeoxyribonuclease-3
MKIRIATWNINSVRLRLNLVERFIKDYSPDILCLQEIKCVESQFPRQRFEALGYTHIEINGQKGYHGVATLSRVPIRRPYRHDFDGSGEARHLAVEINSTAAASGPIILHNFYVPAGGDEPDEEVNPKFKQKLAFLKNMEGRFRAQKLKSRNRMILVGDLNVAPLENDVWSHKQLLRVVSHTPVEVESLNRLQNAHRWIDVMRLHVPEEEKLFTWWSYRARDWRASNRGRRLDHIWMTPALTGAALRMEVADHARDWDKPSDHAPVVADFDLTA